MKGQNYPPKVSMKDSREIPDTMVMHIAETFPFNEPLLYANLTSYFAMEIFLSGLSLLIVCIQCIVIRRQCLYIRGRSWSCGFSY